MDHFTRPEKRCVNFSQALAWLFKQPFIIFLFRLVIGILSGVYISYGIITHLIGQLNSIQPPLGGVFVASQNFPHRGKFCSKFAVARPETSFRDTMAAPANYVLLKPYLSGGSILKPLTTHQSPHLGMRLFPILSYSQMRGLVRFIGSEIRY